MAANIEPGQAVQATHLGGNRVYESLATAIDSQYENLLFAMRCQITHNITRAEYEQYLAVVEIEERKNILARGRASILFRTPRRSQRRSRHALAILPHLSGSETVGSPSTLSRS